MTQEKRITSRTCQDSEDFIDDRQIIGSFNQIQSQSKFSLISFQVVCAKLEIITNKLTILLNKKNHIQKAQSFYYIYHYNGLIEKTSCCRQESKMRIKGILRLVKNKELIDKREALELMKQRNYKKSLKQLQNVYALNSPTHKHPLGLSYDEIKLRQLNFQTNRTLQNIMKYSRIGKQQHVKLN